MQLAACRRPAHRGVDWFPGPTDKAEQRRALRVCDVCPVRSECLAAHLDEEAGIFGGTTARQRANLRRGGHR